MEKHFCDCPNTPCPKHPANHSHGCDPCVRDNLSQKKMPACFFLAVHKDVGGLTDYSIAGFVEFFNQHSEEYFAE